METLSELVTRERARRWPSRRDADRATGISYATWQNVEVRGTIPTLIMLTRIAKALEIPEDKVRTAALVSQAARDQAMTPPTVVDASPPVSRRRRAPGTRRDTGSTPQDPHAE